MPWINKEECTYCGTCIHECPVGAISGQYTFAEIAQERCIRCGICHTVCPSDAVKHDVQRINAEVARNLAISSKHIHECGVRLGNGTEKMKSLNRHIRYYKLQKKIIDRTILGLQALEF